MNKILIAITLTFPLIANAVEVEFNSAFGVKFNEPYKTEQYSGSKILVTPPIRAENIFDDYYIVLDKNNLVEGIFASGFAHGKRKSCQESMFGLSERFYSKYKNSFDKVVEDNSVSFKNNKYTVNFMCYQNTVMFAGIKLKENERNYD